MNFQAFNFKRNYFLDLLDNNHLPIKPTYIKSGPWLKLIGYLDFLCTKVIRAITNYMLIEEYQLRFFPKEIFNCLYEDYPIESRHNIFH